MPASIFPLSKPRCVERFHNRSPHLGRFLLLTFCLLLLPSILSAQPSERRPKKKPEPSVLWSARSVFDERDSELLPSLSRRAEVTGLALFLDRRVDPQTPVTYSSSDGSLFDGLLGMAESCGFSLAAVGPIFYVGPPDAAGELLLLLALHQQSKSFAPNPAAVRLEKSVPLRAPEFSEPRKLLEELAKNAKFDWNGLEMMPFDCWRAVDLPPTPTELLIGFNVDYRIDEKKAVIKPVSIPRGEQVTRNYSPAETAELVRDAYPGCSWTEAAGRVRVDGPFSEVARIEYAVFKARMKMMIAQELAEQAERPVPSGGRNLLLSGAFRQTELSTVLTNLARTFGTEFVLDSSLEAAGISPETRISCEFDRVDRKKAAKIIADTLGVSVRADGEKTIFYRKD